jgi:hypothetical protein
MSSIETVLGASEAIIVLHKFGGIDLRGRIDLEVIMEVLDTSDDGEVQRAMSSVLDTLNGEGWYS